MLGRVYLEYGTAKSNLIRYAEHCRVLGNLLRQDLVIRTLSALVNQTYIDNDARHALPLKTNSRSGQTFGHHRAR